MQLTLSAPGLIPRPRLEAGEPLWVLLRELTRADAGGARVEAIDFGSAGAWHHYGCPRDVDDVPVRIRHAAPADGFRLMVSNRRPAPSRAGSLKLRGRR